MKSTESNPAPPAPAGDDRGGLLDAIRKAGGKEGAGLKSIKERKAEERKRRGEEEAAPAPNGGGGDLMGDLMSKLTMRRKGISGGKPPPTSDEVTVETEEERDCNDNSKHHLTFGAV